MTMKITKTRQHHINMGPYEFVEFGATVEIETSGKPGDVELATIVLDAALDVILLPDLDDARVHTLEENSYVHPYLEDLKQRSTTRGTHA